MDASDKPIAGAKVYLRNLYQNTLPWDITSKDIKAETQTNAQGEFRLEYTPVMPDGGYAPSFDILAIVRGMAMAWQDLPRSHPWDEPPKQPQNKELLVRLQPEAKISGRVTDEAGRPLELPKSRCLLLAG